MPTNDCAFDRIVLLDVQGLFGGCELWLAVDGSAWGRLVGPPEPGQVRLPERRMAFAVSPDELAELSDLLRSRELPATPSPARPGVPDEARPIVCVEAGGELRAVGKWAGDVHPAFDAIYGLLVRLVKRAADRRDEADSWDGQAPPGFPGRQRITAMSKPGPGV